MNGSRAKKLRRMAYGKDYRKEHLPFKEFQKYTFGKYRGSVNGSWVLIGMRAKYQALKRAFTEGLSL